MILPGQRMPIVIAVRPVDFRGGHNGLPATVLDELELDPHSSKIWFGRGPACADQQAARRGPVHPAVRADTHAVTIRPNRRRAQPALRLGMPNDTRTGGRDAGFCRRQPKSTGRGWTYGYRLRTRDR